MKAIFFTLALIAGTLFARGQTTAVNMQSRYPGPVYYRLLGGDCNNPQVYQVSDPQPFVSPGDNFMSYLPGVGWGGPLPTGIIGVRIYSDDPSPGAGCAYTYTDVFVPSGGPMPLLGGPVFPVYSGLPPIRVLFEIYCGQPTNTFMFY